MARLLDPPLVEIRRLLLSLHKRVDSLLSEALVTLKDPSCGLGLDADTKDEEINRLKRELQEAIPVTFVRYHPMANDHRFLLAIITIISDLEHIGDCAKNICSLAKEIGAPSSSLLLLLQLTQGRALDCFRALYHLYLDDAEVGLANEIASRRSEIEEVFEHILGELEETSSVRLSTRQLERQLLVAMHLKRVCDYTASIADQLIFYTTGSRHLRLG